MQNNTTFFLHFQVQGDGTEWIDAGLPTPNYFYRFNSKKGLAMDNYCIAYLIDGFFATQKGNEYLNDIIARFILTLPIKQRLIYPPPSDALHHEQAYKLKQFQNLRSKANEIKRNIGINADWGDDQAFIELKLWLEYQIKNNGGEGSYVEFDLMLNYALSYYEFKDRSTARSKCRNIWNWYEGRGWSYHVLSTRPKHRRTKKTKEEILMTRRERAISNAKAKAEKAKKAVINAITGLYADEYKKKSGAWHIKRIAETINLDPRVVSKYIKEYEKGE